MRHAQAAAGAPDITPPTKRKARNDLGRMRREVYDAFEEAVRTSAAAQWDTLDAPFQARLFSAVVAAQMAGEGEDPKATELIAMQSSGDHLHWMRAQYQAKLGTAQARGSGRSASAQIEASAHPDARAQASTATGHEPAAQPPSGGGGGCSGPAAAPSPAHQNADLDVFKYAPYQRTVWHGEHLRAVEQVLKRNGWDEQLEKAGTKTLREALAAKVIAELPEGRIKQQLHTPARLEKKLTDMQNVRAIVRSIDYSPDLYFSALVNPNGFQAEFLRENSIVIPEAFKKVYAERVEKGTWKVSTPNRGAATSSRASPGQGGVTVQSWIASVQV